MILAIGNLKAISENTFFVNEASLSDDYKIYWNYTNTEITFKAVVKPGGWIGFGLSPTVDGVSDSDLIVAWTNPDGTNQFHNAHTEQTRGVVLDTTQHWKKLFSLKTNDQTILIFTRKIKVCPTDMELKSARPNIEIMPTNNVIYDYGASFSNELTSYKIKNLALLGQINRVVELPVNTEILQYETSVSYRV